jgi:3-hydroxyacyl-[acyl-carrier-protein] dehydratase
MQPDAIEAVARPGRKRPLYAPAPEHAVDLDRASIERLLQHRDPFLFLDRITAVDLARPAVACRRLIDPADPVFAGHFPGHPIYPGVLLLETMGQAGLALLGLVKNGRATVGPEDAPRPIRGLKVHHTVFLAEVRPGDDLVVLATVLEDDAYTGTCAGQIIRGGTEVCCFGIMEVYFVDA